MTTRIYVVGIQQDDGTVSKIKSFESLTWAHKREAEAGEFARTAVIDVELTNTPLPVAVETAPVVVANSEATAN